MAEYHMRSCLMMKSPTIRFYQLDEIAVFHCGLSILTKKMPRRCEKHRRGDGASIRKYNQLHPIEFPQFKHL